MNRIKDIPVVFLLGVGRCGMYLVSSILDWHEQVIIMPFSMKFYAIWDKYNCSKIKDPDLMADLIIAKTALQKIKPDSYESQFCSEITYDFSNIDWEIYESTFRSFLKQNRLSRKNVYLGMFAAYAKSCDIDSTKVKYIIADCFYADYMTSIGKDFVNARFIHVLRDHRANISSLKAFYLGMYGSLTHPSKGFVNKRSLLIHIIKDYMYPIMKMLDQNYIQLNKKKLKVIRYEDVVIKSETTILNLAEWLGIEVNDALYTLTKAGRPFRGDSGFSQNPINELSSEPVFRWEKHLTKREVIMIEFLFGKNMEKFEYKRKFGNISWFIGILYCLLPWKGELFYFGFRRKVATDSTLKNFLRFKFLPFIDIGKNTVTFFNSRFILLRMIIKGDLKRI